MARGEAVDSRLGEPSNPVLLCETLGRLFMLYCSSSLRCINECLAVDSGGYVYKCTLIAAELDASERS